MLVLLCRTETRRRHSTWFAEYTCDDVHVAKISANQPCKWCVDRHTKTRAKCTSGRNDSYWHHEHTHTPSLMSLHMCVHHQKPGDSRPNQHTSSIAMRLLPHTTCISDEQSVANVWPGERVNNICARVQLLERTHSAWLFVNPSRRVAVIITPERACEVHAPAEQRIMATWWCFVWDDVMCWSDSCYASNLNPKHNTLWCECFVSVVSEFLAGIFSGFTANQEHVN